MARTFEWECPKCHADNETQWDWDDVQCPSCKTWFETDFDENYDGLLGPWIAGEVSA